MTIDLSARGTRGNRYPAYAYLRQHEPVSIIKSPFMGKKWFVTRYKDVLLVLKDPRFSSDQRKGGNAGLQWLDRPWVPRIFRTALNSMVAVDDPDHRRLRDIVHKAFTPRMIERMTPRIETLSNELLDQAAKQSEIDLISAFALPIPLTIIAEMMGVSQEDRLRFHRWVASFVAVGEQPWKLPTQIARPFQLFHFFRELVELRRKDPQDDLVTALVQAETENGRLSEDELLAMLFLLLLAGHETTVNLIGNGTLALLEHPDQLQKLYEHPELIESAVEELLRYDGPVERFGPRIALEEVELSGQRIPKGSGVLLGLGSANRDETVFENPAQLDISRTPNRHLAFGMGIHFCLGAPLARLEGRIAIQTLVQRYPHMQLAIPFEDVKRRKSTTLHGLHSLPLKLQ